MKLDDYKVRVTAAYPKDDDKAEIIQMALEAAEPQIKSYIISKLGFGERLKKSDKTEYKGLGQLTLNQAIFYATDEGYNLRNTELNAQIDKELKELEELE